jgi:2-polyprenyl-6-methoxyphenol hydroxylase-like FAD-dependent oxidoreductase
MKAIIVGGGIGGLAAALALHAKGIGCDIYEQSPEIRELGVGINTLPHAIKELAGLGLLPALDAAGIRTAELIYMNRHGQRIWREPRGLDAGFDVPQFSIHRGKLQGVLHEAVLARIGAEHIHTGRRLVGLSQDEKSVEATFARRGRGPRVKVRGNVLIGADGIHSTVRAHFYPDEGPPTWNGIMLWRGATQWKPFLTGRSMIVAGGMAAKLVLYPIHVDPKKPGRALMNWAVAARTGEGKSAPPRREDWSRPGRMAELLPFVEGTFYVAELDHVALIKATGEFYEYPMCDRDPLPRWSHGRVTLLGDAAHPMYPVGSNGASQAVLDAVCLAGKLVAMSGDPIGALAAYEAERLPKTAEIVRSNRLGGPERVIDVIEERAPDGFARIEDIATEAELTGIVRGYAAMAGFDKRQVNR